jgi:hypothetical protein
MRLGAGATADPGRASILLWDRVMRASFPPTPLQVAVLLGWTVYGAVRERLAEFEARLRRRPATVEVVAAPAAASYVVRSSATCRPDYSLN